MPDTYRLPTPDRRKFAASLRSNAASLLDDDDRDHPKAVFAVLRFRSKTDLLAVADLFDPPDGEQIAGNSTATEIKKLVEISKALPGAIRRALVENEDAVSDAADKLVEALDDVGDWEPIIDRVRELAGLPEPGAELAEEVQGPTSALLRGAELVRSFQRKEPIPEAFEKYHLTQVEKHYSDKPAGMDFAGLEARALLSLLLFGGLPSVHPSPADKFAVEKFHDTPDGSAPRPTTGRLPSGMPAPRPFPWSWALRGSAPRDGRGGLVGL